MSETKKIVNKLNGQDVQAAINRSQGYTDLTNDLKILARRPDIITIDDLLSAAQNEAIIVSAEAQMLYHKFTSQFN